MKKTSRPYRYIAIFIIILMTTPLLVNHIPGIPKAYIFGVESPNNEQKLSWQDGSAQQAFEKTLMEKSVSRSYLLRFRNQYHYSLFGKINASDIYEYNDNYFRLYIPGFNEAMNFVEKDSIENTLNSILKLQHQLGDSIPIITIIPPNKNHYYSHDLPERNKTNSKETNYHYVVSGLKEKKLPFIDFNQYFLNHKSETPAIFSKYGIHWTHYAAAIASDSLIRFVSHLKHTNYDSFEFAPIYHGGFNVDDLDLALLRNMLVKPKDHHLRDVIISPKKGQRRLNTVIIGDSYFLAIQNNGVRNSIFSTSSNYHYYFSRSYDHNYKEIPFNMEEIKHAIQHADCILLINDIINLETFGFGFPQKISGLIGEKK